MVVALATVVSAIAIPTQTWSFLQVIFSSLYNRFLFFSLYLYIYYERKMTINAKHFAIKLELYTYWMRSLRRVY
jgi:hypothetical protein